MIVVGYRWRVCEVGIVDFMLNFCVLYDVVVMMEWGFEPVTIIGLFCSLGRCRSSIVV